jgi:hypothetical protein
LLGIGYVFRRCLGHAVDCQLEHRRCHPEAGAARRQTFQLQVALRK